MTNWNLLFRRAHLFLGMLLMPWVLMYALSTALFNHGLASGHSPAASPQWLLLWEKDFTHDVPADGDDALRDATRQILLEHGLDGAFFVQRQGARLNIHVQNFWRPVRLTGDLERKKLIAEQKKFAWPEVLTRLHFRVGYGQPGFLNNLWAFAVDAFCVTLLLWIGTGLYLWWKLPDTRAWGFAALGGGLAGIAVLLVTL